MLNHGKGHRVYIVNPQSTKHIGRHGTPPQVIINNNNHNNNTMIIILIMTHLDRVVRPVRAEAFDGDGVIAVMVVSGWW